MAKATIEVEIPDGYEFARYDVPNRGEYILYSDEVSEVQSKLSHKHIIVRKVEPVTELAVRFKPGWIAMDKSGDWWWYESRPDRVEGTECFTFSSGEAVHVQGVVFPSVTDWKQSLMRVG